MSEKFREIEVYVDSDALEKFGHPNYSAITVRHKNCGYNLPPVKCILKIPVPEKKIEITESMLDNFFEKFSNQGSADFYKNMLKQKLFGN